MTGGRHRQSTPERVVIVGNHKILRQGLRMLLEKHLDVVVVGAFDWPEAVNHAIELAPDVVFVDLGPSSVASRLDAIRSLHASAPGVRVIIQADDMNDPSLVDQALAAGVSGFLPNEPDDLDQILTVFRQARKGQSVVSERARENPDTLPVKKNVSSPTRRDRLDRLTNREVGVLELVSDGYTDRQIADLLLISERYVRSLLNIIFHKLDVADRVEAATFAIRAFDVNASRPLDD